MKNSSGKLKGIFKKIGLFVVLPLFVVALTAHLIFKYSGSGEWEFVGEQNNIKVYSMKVPGETLKKFKAIIHVKSTLGRIVMFMQDSKTDLDAAGIYEPLEFKRDSDLVFWSTWKQGTPDPIQHRDFVIKQEFSQNPETKAVTYQIRATPDMLPLNDCCVRVQRMDNYWELVPEGNGGIEVRWIIDMDIGGNIPYLVMNHTHPDLMYSFGARLQSYFDRKIYEGAQYAWLTEPAQ